MFAYFRFEKKKYIYRQHMKMFHLVKVKFGKAGRNQNKQRGK